MKEKRNWLVLITTKAKSLFFFFFFFPKTFYNLPHIQRFLSPLSLSLSVSSSLSLPLSFLLSPSLSLPLSLSFSPSLSSSPSLYPFLSVSLSLPLPPSLSLSLPLFLSLYWLHLFLVRVNYSQDVRFTIRKPHQKNLKKNTICRFE